MGLELETDEPLTDEQQEVLGTSDSGHLKPGRPAPAPPLPRPRAKRITEAQVMLDIETAFDKLDDREVARIVRWVADRWQGAVDRDFHERDIPRRAPEHREGILSAGADVEDLAAVTDDAADIIDLIKKKLSHVLRQVEEPDDAKHWSSAFATMLVENFGGERLVRFVQAFSYDVIALGDRPDADVCRRFLQDVWSHLQAQLGLTYGQGQ